jgi:hypothetical protein
MTPAIEDAQLTLENLRAWRDRFQKTVDEDGNLGSVLWVQMLNSILDDPVACEAWSKLPNARAQVAELARMTEKVLLAELGGRNRQE